jgi:pSer/pThr/pTyr-binding forkhead associated (FHA) protein
VSLAQRFERRLEGLVGGAFARVFKGQVEPVEIGNALQREATDKRNVMGNGQVLSPNRYRVTLSPSDYERLVPWEAQLTNSLAELVQDYLDENGWATIGDIEVYLALDDQLHTGVFGVASRMEPQAPPRRRPYDSLSLPVVPGLGVGEYAQPYNPQAQAAPPVYAGGYADPAAEHAAPQPHYPPQPPFPPRPPAPQPVYAQPPAAQPPAAQPGYPRPGQPAYPQQPGYPPRTSATPALVVDETNERFELRHGSNVVGRGTDADLQLLDQGVSRRHLDVQYDGNTTTVYDLGSTNGTSVNGHEVGSHQLRHGDVIRIGHTRLVFQEQQR